MAITLNRETAPPANSNPAVVPQHFDTGGTSVLNTGKDNPLPTVIYGPSGNIISSTNRLPVDAQLSGSNSVNMQDSTGGTFLDIGAAQGDGVTLGSGFPTGGFRYNESNWDRVRNNTQGTLLASAARTTNTYSPTQTNYNARGVQVIVNVTTASGTGGITVLIKGVDPVSGSSYQMNVAPSAITAKGVYVFELFPGASTSPNGSNIHQRTAGVLPRTWILEVLHGDSTNYQYSAGYALVN